MTAIASFTRQSLLLILCGGAIGLLINVIINKPSKPELATFDFPPNVTLSSLSLLASKPLAAHSFPNGMVATGRSYRYQQHPQPNGLPSATAIEIEVRYINDAAITPLDNMLQVFTPIPATAIQPSTIKEQPGLGFYHLLVDRKTAYFSTCINPQGITTVTGQQFNNNINRNLLSGGTLFNRLMPWLWGTQPLKDSRCLWTVISTPIDPAEPNVTMKKLEIVGVNWIRWWQLHFPAA